MALFKSKKTFLVVVIGGGAVLLLIFLLLGPPKILAKSDRPAFCVGCHVMEAEYNAWAQTGAHRRKACVDCHLPNENAGIHYVWKA
ncbi:MAG TPA: NapC/NirT family cytochrome c, partial [Nitrospirota bacterium]